MKLLVATSEEERLAYESALAGEIESSGLDFEIMSPSAEPSDIDVIIYAPNGPISDFSPYKNLKLVQSIWAGVDAIIGNETLGAPLCRLVDDGLKFGMREYVSAHILADHTEIARFEAAKIWDDRWLDLAHSKLVAIIGMGTLGLATAKALDALGFQVEGWSRSQKSGAFPMHSGEGGLYSLLARADYIVTLLPHTPETEDLVDAKFFEHIKAGAMLINPGRGALIDEDALIEALDHGRLRRAVLDVFKTEPLPAEHPFWRHPKILVTPHIAAKSRVETASKVIARNLANLAAKRPFEFLVDRETGY